MYLVISWVGSFVVPTDMVVVVGTFVDALLCPSNFLQFLLLFDDLLGRQGK